MMTVTVMWSDLFSHFSCWKRLCKSLDLV